MKNFIFKSNDSDLQKIIQLIETKLDILNKNTLYVTHAVDKCLSTLHEIKLQKQVDEYFGSKNPEDTEDIPEDA